MDRSRLKVHIIPRFGASRVSVLTAEDAENMASDLRQHLAASTVNQVILNLSLVLDFCVRKKWIRRNPLRDQPVKVRGGKRQKVRMPTREEMKALLSAAWRRDPREKVLAYVNRIAIVSLGIFGGLRSGEMAGLQWSDIDFKAGCIRIRHSFSIYDGLKEPKSTAGERVIPLSSPIRMALAEVLRYWQQREDLDEKYVPNAFNRPSRKLRNTLVSSGHMPDLNHLPQGYVLRTTVGKPVLCGEYWVSLMQSAGLFENGKALFSIHKMRHAAASLFIEAGLPAMNLKHLIGHSDIRTTFNVYGHLFPDDRRAFDAADAIAEQFAATNARQIPVSI